METNKQNQFTSVDAYLAYQPEQKRLLLEQIRQLIKKTVPEAQEVMSYQMPAFKYYGMLAFYAAFTSHIGFFIPPKVLECFKDKLSSYKLAKATIRLPLDEPLPLKLIAEIVKCAANVNLCNAELRKTLKKKK